MAGAHNERFSVAVVGMSGRFPGASSLSEYWQNLVCGLETIRHYTDDELLKMGVSPEHLLDPNFVRAGAHIPDRDLFAASFFGYSPREAELMDPQQRLFLECSWEALENAGYAPRSLQGQTGVFAGTSLSSYLLFNLLGNPKINGDEDSFQVMIGSDKDFISTRLSYKLNLKGPSFTVQSGCSTGLTAVHLAVQSLLAFQCDTAIAGGVSIGVPQRTGYYYEPNGIVSPDGHCRAFDAESAGTLFGEGIGVVVLKRLEDALRGRDFVYAVILGTAINNDGSAKVGYTAPSVEGQSEVIALAHAVAGVTADTISYVEAHGTGTGLGDPAEISGLTKAFRRTTAKNAFCGIGTVKSNIGHLDAAAGVAGFIKTALMLHYKQLVPSLHFKAPNPKIDFANSPFYVVATTQTWNAAGTRRAGVSSFGIGGTNVHAVLEEAPPQLSDLTRKPAQILSVSAQTKSALESATDNLVRFLETSHDEQLPDVAYTLHTGREQFKHRRSVICYQRHDGLEALTAPDRERVFTGTALQGLKVAFMFPGGGTQYPGMGSELYETEPRFREQIDLCCSLLKNELGYELQTLLYPSEKAADRAAAQLMRTSAGLPAIFATEYALSMLLMSWGIKPEFMLGHSLGEYTAACLAGVFSLEQALSLVAFRGRLFEQLPCGSMVSVYLSEIEVRPLLNKDLSIAAINGPSQCVISGPSAEIENLCRLLEEKDVEFHRLHIDAAAHSSMVEPAMAEFRRFLSRMQLGNPTIPFISNSTGTWITPAQATDPEYWVQHLRHTVRFADGLSELMSKDNVLALEVGPSRTLSSLAAPQFKQKAGLILSCLRHPQDSVSELLVVYRTLARMWNAGVRIDWQAFYAEEMRRRIPLPTYPFERERYWIEPHNEKHSARRSVKKANARAQAYTGTWTETPLPLPINAENAKSLWVLLLDDLGIGESLQRSLAQQAEKVIGVKAGKNWDCSPTGIYTVAVDSEADFDRLFQTLLLSDEVSVNLVHLWSLSEAGPMIHGFSEIPELRQKTLSSLLAIGKALGRMKKSHTVRFFAVSNGMAQVGGTEALLPEKAAFAAACRVLPQELESFSTQVIDVSLEGPRATMADRIAGQLLAEVRNAGQNPLVAYRGFRRWLPEYQPLPARLPGKTDSPLRENGVYLITGGTGALGPIIAKSFAARQRCNLVLVARSAFPSSSDWDGWLRSHPADDRTSQTIRALQEIESMGSMVTFFKADISDESAMSTVLDDILQRFGGLHGVVHLAGVTGTEALRLVTDLTAIECERQFAPKVNGCYVLGRLLENIAIDFCLLFSSTASILGGAGMTAYSAANGYLDAFALARSLDSGQKWFSINWDAWLTEASPAFMGSGKTALDRFAIPSEDAIRILHEILMEVPGQYIVSTGDVQGRIEEATEPSTEKEKVPSGSHTEARPILSSDYAAPVTQLQKEIAAVWGEVLGVDKVGLYDNLFELGGNSLIGLRIISRLKRALDVNIPVTALFEGPTVFALSQLVGATHPAVNDYQSSKRRGEMRRQMRAAH